jgi:hypothetical protein
VARRVLLLVLLVAAIGAACGDAAAVPSSSAQPGPTPAADASVATPRPTVSPPEEADPPAPSPTLVATSDEWSEPQRVAKGSCHSITALFDDAGTAHVAGTCGHGIVYVSERDGDWVADRLSTPAGYDDMDPQLAVDDGRLTLGFSRFAAEDGACGGANFLDTGVFVRTRALPDGGWSRPSRLGRRDDELEALRIRGDTMHVIVAPDGGDLVYETRTGDVERRYSLGGDPGSASLRVGNDGRARVASAGGGAVRYGRFTGESFAWDRVPGTSNAYDPLLVLGSSGEAHVVWTRDSSGRGGCAGVEPDDRDGTYYATNAGGSWVVDRVSKAVGSASFTVDPASGRVHLAIFDHRGRYFTTSGDGSWTSKRLPTVGGYGGIIRLDPASGRLLIAYPRYEEDGEPGGIFVLTRN